MPPRSDLHSLLTTPPSSVCVLRLSAIGDVCNTVPLIRNLQRAWPHTQLTWIIGTLEASLVGDLPGIEFLRYDKRARQLDGHKPQHLLSARRFDLLLNLQASWRANALAWPLRAPIKLGFDRQRARDGQWLFTTHAIAAQPRSRVAEGFLQFGDALGIARGPLRWDIPLSNADLDFARTHITDAQPSLVLSPCSSQRARNFRNWPVARYIEVIRRAHDEHGLHTVLTGGRSDLERDYGAQISAAAGRCVTNLIGQTQLKQLLALIARAVAVLAPDSGPIHMASAVGTPAIGLFATSNPARTGPIDDRWCVSVYEHALQQFSQRSVDNVRWGQRVRDPAAMALISVEAVCAQLHAVVNASPAQRQPPWAAQSAG